jgi:hypothetical protein
VGRHEEAIRRHEKAAGWRQKEVEEREKTVEQREREVQESGEKVAELERAIDEREQALDQRGSEVEERFKRVGRRHGNAFCSTWWSQRVHFGTWPITPLRPVVFRVLGDKTSSFLVLLLPSLRPLTQVLPTQILPLPPSPLLLNPPSNKIQMRPGSPTRSIPLNR